MKISNDNNKSYDKLKHKNNYIENLDTLAKKKKATYLSPLGKSFFLNKLQSKYSSNLCLVALNFSNTQIQTNITTYLDLLTSPRSIIAVRSSRTLAKCFNHRNLKDFKISLTSG